MRGWRAWYADGQVYISLELDWSELPFDELQIVRVYLDTDWRPGRPYTRTIDGADWVFRAPSGRIEAIPSVGWDGWQPRPCGVPAHDIKRGTAVDDAIFRALTERTRAAYTWP